MTSSWSSARSRSRRWVTSLDANISSDEQLDSRHFAVDISDSILKMKFELLLKFLWRLFLWLQQDWQSVSAGLGNGPDSVSHRCLIGGSRKVSKARDWVLKYSHCFEIWRATRQQCCREACQISEQLWNSNHRSRALETWRDLTIGCLTRYWIATGHYLNQYSLGSIMSSDNLKDCYILSPRCSVGWSNRSGITTPGWPDDRPLTGHVNHSQDDVKAWKRFSANFNVVYKKHIF